MGMYKENIEKLKNIKLKSWYIILIIITINDTSTNIVHREINQYLILILCIIFVVINVIKKILKPTFDKNKILLCISLLLILIYGVILSVFNGGIQLYSINDIIFILISILFFLFSIDLYDKNINLNHYFILTISLILMSGSISINNGLTLDLVMEEGKYRDYSQGLSFVFSIFLISMYNHYLNEKKIIYLFSILICFLLVIYGAARGEFLALTLTIIIMSIKRNFIKTIILICVLIFVISVIIIKFELENELLLINRLSQINQNNLGLRDILWLDGYNLIINDVSPIGNGLSYFQKYYNYESSKYPHNLFIEIIITYGIFGFILSFLMLVGCVNIYKNQNTLNLIVLFAFLVLLKSGSIFNFFSFWVISMLLYNSFNLIKNINVKKYFKL